LTRYTDTARLIKGEGEILPKSIESERVWRGVFRVSSVDIVCVFDDDSNLMQKSQKDTSSGMKVQSTLRKKQD